MTLSYPQVRLLLPLGLGMALSLTGDSTLYAVLPNQVQAVGIGLGAVGVLLGANRLIRIPGNLLAGALNDRLGRRRLFLTGLALGVLSTLSYSLVRGFWPLLAGRLLWGTAWALINVGGYTMILDRSTPANRGRMTGLYQMAFMVGLTISPILGGTLTDVLGFRPALRLCAAVSAAGLAVAVVALPETRPPATGGSGRPWDSSRRQHLAEVARMWFQTDTNVRRADLIYLLILLVNSGILMSTVSLYLKQRWESAPLPREGVIGVASLAGAMLAMRAMLGMWAGPVAGTLSDRGHGRWPVVRGSLLLGSAGFVMLASPSGLWAVPAGVALVALGAGGSAAALAAIVGDQAMDDHPGLAMGGMATAGDIGSATGPLLAYVLAPLLGLRLVYLLCAGVLTLALLITAGHRTISSRSSY